MQDIVQQIREKYDPESIILFGSYAYGQPRPASDVDLAVIKDTTVSFGQRLIEVAGLIHSRLGTEVLVYAPAAA